MSNRKIDREALLEVMAVAKRLDDKNLVNTFEGNISTKKDGLIYITPTSRNKGLLTEDMIAVIDEEGKMIAGSCKPTSELPMHTETYTIRDDIGGVVHCHPPYLTAYALCNKDVETRAYPEMMGNFVKFECAPYGRPGTEFILKGAIPILQKPRDIVLLGNHGVLVVGKTVTDAMNKCEAAEAIAKALFLAHQLGGEKPLSKEECQFFLDVQAEKSKKH